MRSFNHINFSSIGEADLLDFIESRHHAMSKSMLKLMARNFKSASKGNLNYAIHLQDLVSLLEQIEVKVNLLIVQEENSLFPFVRKLIEIKENPEPIRFLNVRLMESSIRRIQEEHTHIEALLHSIKRLTNNFHPPLNSDELLKLCFAELKEFNNDFLQNLEREKINLFPKIIELEAEVMKLSSLALVGKISRSNDD